MEIDQCWCLLQFYSKYFLKYINRLWTRENPPPLGFVAVANQNSPGIFVKESVMVFSYNQASNALKYNFGNIIVGFGTYGHGTTTATVCVALNI